MFVSLYRVNLGSRIKLLRVKKYTSPLISSVMFVFHLSLFSHTYTDVLKGVRWSSVSQLFSLSVVQA